MKWILFVSIALSEPQRLDGFESYEACVRSAYEILLAYPESRWRCVADGAAVWPRPGGKW
jgi:hypothetical protein